MNYVIGIAENGEHLTFERWVYESWVHGTLRDEFLLRALYRCCGRFTILY
jgi:hypothetical protein